MSQHQTVFTVEKPVPVAEAAPNVALLRELPVREATQLPATVVFLRG